MDQIKRAQLQDIRVYLVELRGISTGEGPRGSHEAAFLGKSSLRTQVSKSRVFGGYVRKKVMSNNDRVQSLGGFGAL